MEILCVFLLLCFIAMTITCIYLSNKSKKENDELRKEINELKSQIDGYDSLFRLVMHYHLMTDEEKTCVFNETISALKALLA